MTTTASQTAVQALNKMLCRRLVYVQVGYVVLVGLLLSHRYGYMAIALSLCFVFSTSAVIEYVLSARQASSLRNWLLTAVHAALAGLSAHFIWLVLSWG